MRGRKKVLDKKFNRIQIRQKKVEGNRGKMLMGVSANYCTAILQKLVFLTDRCVRLAPDTQKHTQTFLVHDIAHIVELHENLH